MMNLYNPNNRKNSKKQKNNLNNLILPTPRGEQSGLSKTNESNIAALAGNWIEAVGAIITAIGSTPSTIFTQQTLTDFNLIGNILEAGGSAIAAEGEEALLNRVGEQIQAIGNVAAVAGILNKNEQTSQLLGKQGDLLQLVGIGVTINTQRKQTLLETISNTGDIIQFIGTAIQVFVNTDALEGVVMNAVGAWIEAVGAIITALATDK